jgi:hypothetical protein
MRTIKKIAILLLAFMMVQVAAAQNDSTKVEIPRVHNSYLPEKGNFAIGADATPLLNFVGNMFNGNVDNQFDISSPLIYAKYYLTDMTALRTVFGVNTTSDNQLFYVQDDAAKFANPLSNAQVTDNKTDNSNNYYLSLGLQNFIGQKRLRGFYGAQLFVEYGKDKATYAYGNPMTSLNPTPSSNFGYVAGQRKLSEVTANDFMVGAGGIAGFEYYVAPRLCIGGEVSLNIVYTQKLQTYQKSERIVGDKVISIDKANSPGGHELNFQTSSFTPNTFQHVGLYVMLHF